MSRVVAPVPLAITEAEPPVVGRKPVGRWRRFAEQFISSKMAVFGLIALVLAILAAILAPWLAPQNPFDLASLDILDAKMPPGSTNFDGSLTYWLGTDGQARDILSAILYGMRTSLFVGFVSVLSAFVIGTAVGLVAAYFGGRIDAILMRTVDIQLSFPSILVALVLLAVLGKGVDKVIIALIVVQWAYFARAARSGDC